jgi:hypothetical protein
VIEHRRLGRVGCAPIVVSGDRVEHLGEQLRCDSGRVLLDDAYPKMDVAE